MGRFGEDPLKFFSDVYRQAAPWDIGAPQPALMELLADFPPLSPILDVGCGTGDSTLAMAGLGYSVVGVDFVASAIHQAKQKLKLAPGRIAGKVEFVEADALRPQDMNRSFGSIVDSGFYHLLDQETGREYVENLRAVLKPGGRLYLLEFALEFDIPNVPRAIGADELERLLSPENGWEIKVIRSVRFENRVSPVPALAACAISRRAP